MRAPAEDLKSIVPDISDSLESLKKKDLRDEESPGLGKIVRLSKYGKSEERVTDYKKPSPKLTTKEVADAFGVNTYTIEEEIGLDFIGDGSLDRDGLFRRLHQLFEEGKAWYVDAPGLERLGANKDEIISLFPDYKRRKDLVTDKYTTTKKMSEDKTTVTLGLGEKTLFKKDYTPEERTDKDTAPIPEEIDEKADVEKPDILDMDHLMEDVDDGVPIDDTEIEIPRGKPPVRPKEETKPRRHDRPYIPESEQRSDDRGEWNPIDSYFDERYDEDPDAAGGIPRVKESTNSVIANPFVPTEMMIKIFGLGKAMVALSKIKDYPVDILGCEAHKVILRLAYREEEFFERFGKYITKTKDEIWETLCDIYCCMDKKQLIEEAEKAAEHHGHRIDSVFDTILLEPVGHKTIYQMTLDKAMESGKTIVGGELLDNVRNVSGLDVSYRDIEALGLRTYGERIHLGYQSVIPSEFADTVVEVFTELGEVYPSRRETGLMLWRVDRGMIEYQNKWYQRIDDVWREPGMLPASGDVAKGLEFVYQTYQKERDYIHPEGVVEYLETLDSGLR